MILNESAYKSEYPIKTYTVKETKEGDILFMEGNYIFAQFKNFTAEKDIA